MKPDPWLAPDTAPVRRQWLAPLADWLRADWLAADRTVRLLDFGCGDLQLASLLPAAVRVDGYDRSPAAVAAGRAQLARLGRPGQVVGSTGELVAGSYRVIVLSSMVQYVEDVAAFEGLVATLVPLLAPDGVGMVMTDVVSSPRSRRRDGVDTWRFLRSQAGLAGAAAMLAQTVRRSPGRLTALSPGDVEAVAVRAGLRADNVEPNLSPFTARRTHVLRRATGTLGPVREAAG